MAKIYLGTSGWSYKDWVNVFYPSEQDVKLSYYSQFFNTVEIDSTFYSYPSKGMVYGWLRATRNDFIFSAKLPKIITHKKILNIDKGVKQDLEHFLDLMMPLYKSGKLGPLLIQLPPKFERDYKVLEDFLQILPSEFKFACEFRHQSWWANGTWSLLEKYGVANVILDGPHLPPDPIVTTNFAVIRWHGRGKKPWYNYRYKIDELKFWIPKIESIINQVDELYGYFNNHFHGYAVANCLQMLEILNIISNKQREMKEHVLNYLNGITIPKLVTFDLESARLSDLILIFMDKYRLERAHKINDEEVYQLKFENGKVEAMIREYKVLIDLNSKRILHNCGDWEHQMVRKGFCKHIGKVMYLLPEEKATFILRKIAKERDEWKFEIYH
ncbi:MAG: DUF72 domain-containing protein [Nitrososphaerales archaeon]